MQLRNMLLGGASNDGQLYNSGLLILRLVVGLFMAFGHGLGKVPPSEKLLAGVSDMGFPAPVLFAWLAGLSELAGGIFIAIGFLTRPSAFFLAITMVVAAFIRHASDPLSGKEMAILYLAVSVFLLLAGAGRFSVDHFINRKLS